MAKVPIQADADKVALLIKADAAITRARAVNADGRGYNPAQTAEAIADLADTIADLTEVVRKLVNKEL